MPLLQAQNLPYVQSNRLPTELNTQYYLCPIKNIVIINL